LNGNNCCQKKNEEIEQLKQEVKMLNRNSKDLESIGKDVNGQLQMVQEINKKLEQDLRHANESSTYQVQIGSLEKTRRELEESIQLLIMEEKKLQENNRKLRGNNDLLAEKKEESNQEESQSKEVQSSKNNNLVKTFTSVEEVKKIADQVGRVNLEMYLTDQTFEMTFGMTQQAFHQMPKWKQDNKKKELGLF